MSSVRGFTLIELVIVIVLLGILAAVALPKTSSLKSEAIAAATMGLAATISTTSNNFHFKCVITPSCNSTSNAGVITINGTTYAMRYGWLDAGDTLNTNEIDAAVPSTGFNVSLVNSSTTRWTYRDTASTSCYVEYKDTVNPIVNPTGNHEGLVSSITNNC